MALSDRKITNYANPVSNLPDHPSQEGWTAAQLKAVFDAKANEEIKQSINGIVDDLQATTDGASGADQIGATALKVGGATKVQGQLVELKADAKAELKVHTDKIDNPHAVTKTQVGLGNVDNTSDINKPVSIAQQTALNLKVDKVTGKALSTNDYDNTEKSSVASNTAARHTHANKTLLDSYNQTNVDLTDSVTKKHSHTNKTVLDGITEVTQVLGVAADKIPSEKAVADALVAAGSGDMLKAVYDSNDDGTVNDSDKLGGQLPEYYSKSEDVGDKTLLTTEDKTNLVAAINEHEEQINALATQKAEQTALDVEITNRTNAVATEKNERLAEVAVERARINSFTALAAGSTTGDAELIDARVGADGVTYDNAGSAIRGQINQVKANFESVATLIKSKNLFNGIWNVNTGVRTVNDANIGTLYPVTNHYTSDIIDVDFSINTSITVSIDSSKAARAYAHCYDKNGNAILDSTGTSMLVVQSDYGFFPRTITFDTVTYPNIAIIRIRINTSGESYDFSKTQFEYGIATAYEAYFEPYYILKLEGLSNKKWLFLGDSITAMTNDTSWVNKFKTYVKANEESYNQAVGGATWCDGEAGITYNKTPYLSQNYIGNQVAWVLNTDIKNVDLDCIIIAGGTNDTNINYPTDDNIESAFYDGNALKLLTSVDRTTWQGAIRWTVQTLRENFPNAKIVLVTPLQRRVLADGITVGDMYPTIRQKRETITKMAKRMGVYLIDTAECNITDMQETQYADGLHLSVAGSTTFARFILNKIISIMN